MSLLNQALHELLADLDADHRRVSLVLDGQQADPPADAGLAALADELRRLRWMEPEAPAMALLADAMAAHPEAVESHLAWLAAGATRPAVVLDLPVAKAVSFRLAS